MRRAGDGIWRATKKTVSVRRSTAPVQEELSLDNVKVVRNDLRDADLEVVPLRSAAGRKVGAIVEPTPANPVGLKPWNRLTGRLWRPEPTRTK